MKKTCSIAPRAILMCAGEYEKMEILRRAEDLVIAVDGGLPRLLAQGIEPDLILGDFDSLGEDLFPLLEKLERTGRKKVLRLPREKDDTDTIYAARLCLEQGYRDFLIYGALGGRLDHTMANIQTLAWLRERDARAYLVGKTTLISVLSGEKVTFPENFEGIFSLFALDSRVTGVTLEGMKYPLQDGELTNSFPLGVSNEISSEISYTQRASVTVREGKALMILTKSRGDFSRKTAAGGPVRRMLNKKDAEYRKNTVYREY